jgi:hypothetical protein
MPDNYDRRLKERKIPKEGDTFKVPNVTDDGDLIGWHEHTILTVEYDYAEQLFGVIPEKEPDTRYEIVWVEHMESWVEDGALD